MKYQSASSLRKRLGLSKRFLLTQVQTASSSSSLPNEFLPSPQLFPCPIHDSRQSSSRIGTERVAVVREGSAEEKGDEGVLGKGRKILYDRRRSGVDKFVAD
jgi:hypothetical protein